MSCAAATAAGSRGEERREEEEEEASMCCWYITDAVYIAHTCARRTFAKVALYSDWYDVLAEGRGCAERERAGNLFEEFLFARSAPREENGICRSEF